MTSTTLLHLAPLTRLSAHICVAPLTGVSQSSVWTKVEVFVKSRLSTIIALFVSFAEKVLSVLRTMLTWCAEFKILNVIVRFILVSVMNLLRGFKSTAKMLFHNVSGSLDSSSIRSSDSPIPAGVEISRTVEVSSSKGVSMFHPSVVVLRAVSIAESLSCAIRNFARKSHGKDLMLFLNPSQ